MRCASRAQLGERGANRVLRGAKPFGPRAIGGVGARDAQTHRQTRKRLLGAVM